MTSMPPKTEEHLDVLLQVQQSISADLATAGALAQAADVMKKDGEVVTAAVRQSGPVLQYAVASMRQDKEVVMAAVQDAAHALQYVAEEMKQTLEEEVHFGRQSTFSVVRGFSRPDVSWKRAYLSIELRVLEQTFRKMAEIDRVNWLEKQADRTTESLASLHQKACLLYTSPSPRDRTRSRMPSSA